MNSGASTGARRGFTLMELLVSILIIFLLMGLLIAGVHHVMGRAKGTADRAAVTGLKDGVIHFNQNLGFLPPLVKDDGGTAGADPISTTTGQPVVYSVSTPQDLIALRGGPNEGEPGSIPLFSMYSLPYYLVGVLETDGVTGNGSRAPRRDGRFEKSGRVLQPFYDPRKASVYEAPPPGHGRIELRDRSGVSFRYYRWMPDDGQPNPNHPSANPQVGLDYMKVYANVPRILYDPFFYKQFASLSAQQMSPPLPPDIAGASYAIVGAGPNGLFGDEHLLPVTHPQYLAPSVMADRLSMSMSDLDKLYQAAAADNVVEVGR